MDSGEGGVGEDSRTDHADTLSGTIWVLRAWDYNEWMSFRAQKITWFARIFWRFHKNTIF